MGRDIVLTYKRRRVSSESEATKKQKVCCGGKTSGQEAKSQSAHLKDQNDTSCSKLSTEEKMSSTWKIFSRKPQSDTADQHYGSRKRAATSFFMQLMDEFDASTRETLIQKENKHDKLRQKLCSGATRQQDSSCTELSTRLKSNSNLVAFCRRFVQKRNIPAGSHVTADHAANSILKLPEIDANTRESLTNTGKMVDDHIKFAYITAEKTPLAALQPSKDSVGEASSIHGQRGAQATSCNIHCNITLECGSQKNIQAGTPKVHLSAGPSRKMEKVSTFPKKNVEYGFPAVAVGDKGKGLAGSSLVSTGTSSKNNNVQIM